MAVRKKKIEKYTSFVIIYPQSPCLKYVYVKCFLLIGYHYEVWISRIVLGIELAKDYKENIHYFRLTQVASMRKMHGHVSVH